MQRAIELAFEKYPLWPWRPVCICHRQRKSHHRRTNLVTATNDPTAHAEVVAIRNPCAVLKTFQLEGCDLYTTCEPCPMCLAAIHWVRPSRVSYGATAAHAAAAGFDDPFIYDEIRLPHAERRLPMTQLLHEESLAIFSAWISQSNRKDY